MSNISIGTCGFGWYKHPEGWKKRYKSRLNDYSDRELNILADKLKRISDKKEKIYCLFNIYAMQKNAIRLMDLPGF